MSTTHPNGGTCDGPPCTCGASKPGKLGRLAADPSPGQAALAWCAEHRATVVFDRNVIIHIPRLGREPVIVRAPDFLGAVMEARVTLADDLAKATEQRLRRIADPPEPDRLDARTAEAQGVEPAPFVPVRLTPGQWEELTFLAGVPRRPSQTVAARTRARHALTQKKLAIFDGPRGCILTPEGRARHALGEKPKPPSQTKGYTDVIRRSGEG